jgi:hypothetical protein
LEALGQVLLDLAKERCRSLMQSASAGMVNIVRAAAVIISFFI